MIATEVILGDVGRVRTELATDPAGLRGVAGENRGGQPVLRGVRASDGIFFVVEYLKGLHRAEDLLLDEADVGVDDLHEARAPGVSQRVFGAGTQLLAEEPVKSSTALANASGFSSGMK